MAILSTRIRKYFRNLRYVCIGAVLLSLVIVLIILLIPVLIFRFILTKLVAPCYHPKLAKAMPAFGQCLSTELLPGQINETRKHARNAIVLNLYFPGSLTIEQVAEKVEKGWLSPKPGEAFLKYPEFQQYPTLWKGYMFFKPDTDFSLNNHIYEHTISENASKEDCETILCNLVESLINKQFPPKRSPWEIHLLKNYKNPNIATGNEDVSDQHMSVLIFRFHHGMVDGFSVMNSVVDGICDNEVSSMNVAQASNSRKRTNLIQSLKMCMYIPFRILWDAGKIVAIALKFSKPSSTPWTCPDDKKKWQMNYSRSELISIDKIKFIKNNLKVGHTSVLLSCVSAAAANSFKKKGRPDCTNVPFFCPIPLKNHPDKLRNHA